MDKHEHKPLCRWAREFAGTDIVQCDYPLPVSVSKNNPTRRMFCDCCPVHEAGETLINKIKPCPFCGVIPEIHPEDWDGSISVSIRCENQDCPVCVHVLKNKRYGGDISKRGAFLLNMAAAIQAWNTRVK
jgi:hypothetical protein